MDSDEGAIVIDDEEDIEEIYDDEEEQDEDEDEGEDEEEDDEVEVDEDEEKEVDAPEKPEDKIIKNDVPLKPSDPTKKIEEEVPKTKDNVEIKKPELPKVYDAELKDKSKSKSESDESEKKDDAKVIKDESANLKPEIPEKESSKVIPERKDTAKLKPELDIKEKEPSKVVPKEVSSDSKTEFEIIEREGPKVVSEKDTGKLKPVEPKEKEVPKAVAEKDAPKSKEDDKPPAAKVAAHVKFEDDTKEKKDGDGKPAVPLASGAEVKVPVKPVVDKTDHDENSQFVVLEKGEAPAAQDSTTGGDGPKKTDHSIDSFLLGEQTHSSRLHHHPESIQDQQL